jgi:hypothetical protein
MMNWGRLSYLLTWYALKDLSELLAFASGHSHIINPTSPSPTSPRLRMSQNPLGRPSAPIAAYVQEISRRGLGYH